LLTDTALFMSDPLTQMMESFRDEVLEGVRSIVRSEEARPAPTDGSLDPFRLYTAREAADVLGLDRATMYDIPESELPRCRVGPARGSTRWMGADLLAYARSLDPVDYESVLEEVRSELRRVPSGDGAPNDGPVERVL
jgi:hypothetical protein